mmetsp:Transcript_2192/g.4484  ORF Transcript_2192/g.4484 Transcript_2192/m.4484 type:complete len:289 (+) Transcript_2192:338-1204(+)
MVLGFSSSGGLARANMLPYMPFSCAFWAPSTALSRSYSARISRDLGSSFAALCRSARTSSTSTGGWLPASRACALRKSALTLDSSMPNAFSAASKAFRGSPSFSRALARLSWVESCTFWQAAISLAISSSERWPPRERSYFRLFPKGSVSAASSHLATASCSAPFAWRALPASLRRAWIGILRLMAIPLVSAALMQLISSISTSTSLPRCSAGTRSAGGKPGARNAHVAGAYSRAFSPTFMSTTAISMHGSSSRSPCTNSAGFPSTSPPMPTSSRTVRSLPPPTAAIE